jgi:hypothetical protein
VGLKRTTTISCSSRDAERIRAGLAYVLRCRLGFPQEELALGAAAEDPPPLDGSRWQTAMMFVQHLSPLRSSPAW